MTTARQKSNRMRRIFKIARRTEEQQRAAVAAARREADAAQAEYDAVQAQLEAFAGQSGSVESMRFGRLLVESGLRASEHRRAALDASMRNLEAEYEQWQAERRRADSLEKVVERLAEEARVAKAKADEAEIEELAMSRRAMVKH
jgi:flagellar biosynthesis chaperone FliJ